MLLKSPLAWAWIETNHQALIMQNPSVVFCTTSKGRLDHIRQTLPRNLADNPEVKFVLLDYSSSDGLADYVRQNHMSDLLERKLVFYQMQEPGPFRMAHAKNVAHRCGILEGADVLINLDADNYAPGMARWAIEQFSQREDIFLWPDVKKIKGEEPWASWKGANGRIGVTRHAFLKAGGYDERYITWSPDDKDFDARLRRLGYIRCSIPRPLIEIITHADKMRFKEYPHARELVAGEDGQIVYDPNHTIANAGRFGMGQVTRNFSSTPVILGPLPTRIFGIGWQKTATTSLHHALEILGFDSAHWKNVHWAAEIWDQMHQFGKSTTLEKSYALCDNPIPPLFRLLDIAYPGSKFILTTRNESRWLESCRKHWDHAINPFRWQWDEQEAFSHRMHTAIYGRKLFDAEVFLQRYRRHNAEVLEYFKNRPHDLLVMDMDKAAGWQELCPFLEVGVPDQPYPTSNVVRVPVVITPVEEVRVIVTELPAAEWNPKQNRKHRRKRLRKMKQNKGGANV